MSDKAPAAEQNIEQLLQGDKAPDSAIPKVGVSPLAAAGVGFAAFVVGAGVVALWPSGPAPEVPEPVSVYSCSEQYTTIAARLNALVSEGIDAGQAPTPDVSWVNSIHQRQDDFAAQLDALAVECNGPER